MKNLLKIPEAARELIFPSSRCFICGKTAIDGILCDDCRRRYQVRRFCNRCATIIEYDAPALCHSCQMRKHAFVSARAALPYRDEVKKAIHDFKYHNQTWLKRPFALLAEEVYRSQFAHFDFDMIIPVPIHRERKRHRGYNQAELICHTLAPLISIDYRPDILTRIKDTQPLSQESAYMRYQIMKNAFRAGPEAKDKVILLVDDIYTTGATLDSCTQALLTQGATAVYGITISTGEDKG